MVGIQKVIKRNTKVAEIAMQSDPVQDPMQSDLVYQVPAQYW